MSRPDDRTLDAFASRIGGVVFAMHRHLPFFGMLLESCSVHLDATGRVPTACVDDRGRISFSAAFAATLTDLQLTFVLAHEVCHVAFGHFDRRGSRDPFLWNVAGDFAINALLLSSFQTVDALPPGVLLDQSLAELSTEQIYELLEIVEGDDGDGQKRSDPGNPGKGNANPRPAAGAAPPAKRRVGQGGGAVSRDMDYQGDRAGEQVREARMPIDESEHSPQDAWRGRVAAAAAHARMRGQLPARLERFVTEHLRPKVDWATQLRQFLRYEVSRDHRDQYTFVPCNRRHVHAGLYLPSLVGRESPRIAFAIDTSGSMSEDDLGQAHAEIDAIRRQFLCSVYLIHCDAAVARGRWIGPHETLPMPTGGGGTDFRPVFAHLKAERVAVDAIAYLTDGDGEYGPDPGIPTVWVTTTHLRPPWGECVQVRVDA